MRQFSNFKYIATVHDARPSLQRIKELVATYGNFLILKDIATARNPEPRASED